MGRAEMTPTDSGTAAFKVLIARGGVAALEGALALYLTARITGGHGYSSSISDTPSWDPPSKIAAKYLSPYVHKYEPLRRAEVA
jgi:hypothetical protein